MLHNRTRKMTKPSPDRQRTRHAPPRPKLGPEKLTPEEQRRRFIEAAREAGASEDEAVFDRALGRLVKKTASPD